MGERGATGKIGQGWTIARLAGVPIRVHPTFLLLVALVLLGSDGHPIDALAWLVLVFGSVVIHELAHALVARHRGARVVDILLLPIGGASEIEDLSARPRTELAVAAAGPITSLMLGGTLLAVGLVVHGEAHPALLGGPVLVRLGWTNLLLAGFNLLPALPMDGGRVVRAVLARRFGIVDATVRATAISRGVAVAMAVAGVLVMPWLIVIAAFVWFAGRAEESSVLIHERLAPLHVQDVMIVVPPGADVPTSVRVAPSASLEDALREMLESRVHAAAVVDADDRVIGVLLFDVVADRLQGVSDARG